MTDFMVLSYRPEFAPHHRIFCGSETEFFRKNSVSILDMKKSDFKQNHLLTKPARGVTLRAVIIGLVLIPVNSYFIMCNYIATNSALPTTIALFFNVVISLLLITLLNLPLQKFLPRVALHRGELLTVYIMLSISSAMAGHDMMQSLIPSIPHPFWYATPENEYKALFWRYLPRWLVADNLRGLQYHYQGESSFYTVEHIKTWLTPIIWWSIFLSVLLFTMICINAIIRKQWIDRERLTYPIIQLPLELTQDGGRFFKNKAMWIGFAIAGGIDLINGLHYLFPILPRIPMRHYEIGHYFTAKPWNAIGWTPMFVLPFAVGLAFLIPLEMSFSLWFFYLFWKGERILGNALGLRSLPGFPYDGPQTMGALFGLVFLALWAGRRHLIFVLKSVIKSQPEESDEMSYRTIVLGLIGGVIFLIFFSSRGGMGIWAVSLYLFVYFLLAMSITRIRAEVGTPIHEMFAATPFHFLTQVFGTRRLGGENLTMMALYWGVTRGSRAHPMPHTLEAFKLSEQTQMSSKRVMIAMMIAVIFGVLAAFWAYLDVAYRQGNTRIWYGKGGYDILRHWLHYPTLTDYRSVSFMGVGFAFTCLLWALRMRFPLWALHPAGYAIASSTWTFGWIWFSVFISWTAKTLILKHGGIGTYRRTVPLFLGFILGDYLVGGGWAILRLLTGVRTYVFYR